MERTRYSHKALAMAVLKAQGDGPMDYVAETAPVARAEVPSILQGRFVTEAGEVLFTGISAIPDGEAKR